MIVNMFLNVYVPNLFCLNIQNTGLHRNNVLKDIEVTQLGNTPWFHYKQIPSHTSCCVINC